MLQTKLENSDKSRQIEWWKDRNSPVIKPYSVSVSVNQRTKRMIDCAFFIILFCFFFTKMQSVNCIIFLLFQSFKQKNTQNTNSNKKTNF